MYGIYRMRLSLFFFVAALFFFIATIFEEFSELHHPPICMGCLPPEHFLMAEEKCIYIYIFMMSFCLLALFYFIPLWRISKQNFLPRKKTRKN